MANTLTPKARSLLTKMGYEESKAIEKVKSLLPREWIEQQE